MGNVMHSLKTLLQLPCGWRCSRQIISSGGITLHLHGKRKTAQCPECLKRSDSVHSCRRRRIQHLPCSGQTLWLVFSVRHWYCRNPACSRKIFAESLAPFASSHQQSSQALQNLQRQIWQIFANSSADLYLSRSFSVRSRFFCPIFFASRPISAMTPSRTSRTSSRADLSHERTNATSIAVRLAGDILAIL